MPTATKDTSSPAERRPARSREGTSRHRRLIGDARVFGVEAPWSVAVDEHGAFDWWIGGDLGERLGWDGSDAVARDWSGASRVLEMFDLEARRALVWVLAGAPGEGPADADGRLHYRLERAVDGAPAALRYDTQAGQETWRFEGVTSGGDWIPRRIVKEMAGMAVVDIDVRGGWEDVGERLRLPEWTEPEDFAFTAAADARLAACKGPYGHLLVRASLDGREEGWYILDSGASNSAVTPRTAADNGLERAGTGVVASVMGSARAPIYRAASATVGPLVLRRPRFIELDFAPFGDAFGVPVAGVLGFEVFRRARVRVSFDAPTITVLPSGLEACADAVVTAGSAAPPRAATERPGSEPCWVPVAFNMQHPIIAGAIGGRPAHLRIDIGMGGEVAAIVHPGALERLGVEATFESEPVPMGAGAARAGTVSAIEVAGRRWEPAPIVLPDAGNAVFHDPWVDATIGHGLLRAFEVTFDYPNGRIGFAPAGGGS